MVDDQEGVFEECLEAASAWAGDLDQADPGVSRADDLSELLTSTVAEVQRRIHGHRFSRIYVQFGWSLYIFPSTPKSGEASVLEAVSWNSHSVPTRFCLVVFH